MFARMWQLNAQGYSDLSMLVYMVLQDDNFWAYKHCYSYCSNVKLPMWLLKTQWAMENPVDYGISGLNGVGNS